LVKKSGWTRFNWFDQDTFAFEDMKGTTYKHEDSLGEDGTMKIDMTSTSTMNLINQVEKSEIRLRFLLK